MSNHSPRLDLPYLYPAQAQKHVTVNEAFERLDAIAQLTVEEFDATSPPPGPLPGKIWALGGVPSGVWAGQGGHLAVATEGNGWLFIQPSEGWRAYGKSDEKLRICRGGAWESATPAQLDRLGIGTGADATNRLSIMAPATLLSHAGAGHQIKVNKAGLSDTASLLFQTNWTGHAEMGLAGENDFSIKVSADGNAWTTALRFDGATGQAGGAAIQQDALDGASGKLLKTGSFGLGFSAGLPGGNVDQAALSGFYTGAGGTNTSPSAGDNPFAASAAPFAMQVWQSGSAPDQWVQLAAQIGAAPHLRVRSKMSGATAGAWTDLLTSASVTGQISAGAIIETGSTAQGHYTRFADGTQICVAERLTLTRRSAADCHATWSFPMPFASSGAIALQACFTPADDSSDPFAFAANATPGADQIGVLACGKPTTAQAEIAATRSSGAPDFATGDMLYVRALAIGRWQ